MDHFIHATTSILQNLRQEEHQVHPRWPQEKVRFIRLETSKKWIRSLLWEAWFVFLWCYIFVLLLKCARFWSPRKIPIFEPQFFEPISSGILDVFFDVIASQRSWFAITLFINNVVWNLEKHTRIFWQISPPNFLIHLCPVAEAFWKTSIFQQ